MEYDRLVAEYYVSGEESELVYKINYNSESQIKSKEYPIEVFIEENNSSKYVSELKVYEFEYDINGLKKSESIGNVLKSSQKFFLNKTSP